MRAPSRLFWNNTSGGINPQYVTGIPGEANGNGGALDRVDQAGAAALPSWSDMG